jgi:hypothetical protein
MRRLLKRLEGLMSISRGLLGSFGCSSFADTLKLEYLTAGAFGEMPGWR